MRSLRIACISPCHYLESYTAVKKAANHICDKHFTFSFLPKADDLYSSGERYVRLRRMMFHEEYDLAAVFFDTKRFEASMRLLIEVMAYHPRTAVVVDGDDDSFNAEVFAESMSVSVFVYGGGRKAVSDALDFMKSCAASLLYASPTYINLGGDCDYAISIVKDEVSAEIKAPDSYWSAMMWLLKKDIMLECFDISPVRRICLERAEAVAAEYLDTCVPRVSIAEAYENTINIITELVRGECMGETDIVDEKRGITPLIMWIIFFGAMIIGGILLFD